MFETIRNAFKSAELRKKLLFTLFILIIFRIGSAITVPFVDPSGIASMMQEGSFLGYLDILSGGGFSQATVFAMSITPYINASIIMQLLTIAIPALERMQKEGEGGRKKIAQITRYVTVGLALIQGFGLYTILRNKYNAVLYKGGFQEVFAAIVIIATMTAGASLIMWLGEKINDKGIGNGISIILFAGILSRGPQALGYLVTLVKDALSTDGSKINLFYVPLIVLIFLAVIVFIVIMTNAERRIPVQYAKRVVGRKVYGGQSTHIPIKVSMSGVMPIIFASAIISLPSIIREFVTPKAGGFWDTFFNMISYRGWIYAVVYFVLIIAFNFFYVYTQYNPVEMANNIRKNNGAIPGIRPGKPTSTFIMRVISKVTLIGAVFLAIIAILPIALSAIMKVNISLGGTSILIVVGVALDTMRQMESQMMMRHYKGFLE